MEVEVEADVHQVRIDSYLGGHPALGLTRSRVQKLIEQGFVLLNGSRVSKKSPVCHGDRICVTMVPLPVTKLKGEDIPLDIVFEDDHLAVINKPPGMVVHPGAGNYSGTLVNAIIHYFEKIPAGSAPDRPGIVHRLDKDTSGLLIVAKDEKTYLELQSAIQKRRVQRVYLAVICGHVAKGEDFIDLPIGRSMRDRRKMAVTKVSSREARTQYRLMSRYRSYDLLEVKLLTGRTHQIRVHFSHLGHPVLGDPQYGGREKWHRGIFAPERPLARKLLNIIKRQALHAHRLDFEHPRTGERISVKAEPPEDFRTLVELLELEGS